LSGIGTTSGGPSMANSSGLPMSTQRSYLRTKLGAPISDFNDKYFETCLNWKAYTARAEMISLTFKPSKCVFTYWQKSYHCIKELVSARKYVPHCRQQEQNRRREPAIPIQVLAYKAYVANTQIYIFVVLLI